MAMKSGKSVMDSILNRLEMERREMGEL